MDEREKIIAKATDKATKEAKKQNLNEEQTKLYVETEINKALVEFDEKIKKTVVPTQANALPITETSATTNVSLTTENKEQTKAIKTKYIVHTPVKNFCGEVAGVQFAYGKAEVNPGWILNWFKEHGYRVEEVSE